MLNFREKNIGSFSWVQALEGIAEEAVTLSGAQKINDLRKQLLNKDKNASLSQKLRIQRDYLRALGEIEACFDHSALVSESLFMHSDSFSPKLRYSSDKLNFERIGNLFNYAILCNNLGVEMKRNTNQAKKQVITYMLDSARYLRYIRDHGIRELGDLYDDTAEIPTVDLSHEILTMLYYITLSQAQSIYFEIALLKDKKNHTHLAMLSQGVVTLLTKAEEALNESKAELHTDWKVLLKRKKQIFVTSALFHHSFALDSDEGLQFASLIKANTACSKVLSDSNAVASELQPLRALNKALQKRINDLSQTPFMYHGKVPAESVEIDIPEKILAKANLNELDSSLLGPVLSKIYFPDLPHLKNIEQINLRNFISRANVEQIKKAIDSGERISYARSKLMFVGKGRVGKSSTIRSLLGKKFVEGLDSTVVADAKGQIEIKTQSIVSWKESALDLSKDFKNFLNDLSNDSQRQKKKTTNTVGEKSIRSKNKTKKVKMNDKTMEKVKKVLIERKRFSVGIQEINEVIKEIELKEEDHEEVQRIFTLWDFGGQEVFYTLHHLFLTNNGVYCVCFNAAMLEQKESRIEEIRNLQYWLDSISLHSPNAPILLVGTFFSEVKYKEVIQEVLHDIIIEYPKLNFEENTRDNVDYFPIENNDGNTTKKSDMISTLKKGIEQAVEADDSVFTKSYVDKIPIAWVYFMDQILRENSPTFSVPKMKKLFLKVGFPETDFSKMLSCYHENGTLLKFFDDASTKEEDTAIGSLVILSPEWLIKAVRCIIYDRKLQRPLNLPKSLRKKMRLYESTGIISKQTLMQRLANNGYKGRERDFLLSFYLKSMLVSQYDYYTESETHETKYIVPTMIHFKESDKIKVPHLSYSTFGFKLSFEQGFPTGIYERIICLLLTNCSNEEATAKPKLMENEAAFKIFRGVVYVKKKAESKSVEVIIRKKHAAFLALVKRYLLEIITKLTNSIFKNKVSPKLYLKADIEELTWCEYEESFRAITQGYSTDVETEDKYDTVSVESLMVYFPREIDLLQNDDKLNWDVFLAHEWGVHDQVVDIAHLLKKEKLLVWLDEDCIKREVTSEILRGLHQSRKILFFITRRYIERCEDPKTNAAKEFRTAVTRGVQRLIAVCLEPGLADTTTWAGTILGFELFSSGIKVFDMSTQKRKIALFPELLEEIRR